ncbi:MAG: VWA domain-containing protein [Phycisphaerae bacterium]|jgi:hypothetical protein|nr:VWA domain-containing protein [Phycisphaerae bacterium]
MMLSIAEIMVVAAVFAHPLWLVGVLAVGGPILLASAARRRGRQITRTSVVLQCAALVALAAALARPSLQLPQSSARKWLILNDVSASTRTQQQDADLPQEIFPRLDYSFAAGVARSGQPLDTDQSNLAGALRLAAARSDELAGVIVRTDGNFTDEHWPPAAKSLGDRSVTVAIVALDRPPRDVRISEFTAVRTSGRQVALRASAVANAVTESVIEIPGVIKRRIKLLPNEPVTVSVNTEVPEDRSAKFTVSLTRADAFSENDSATAGVGPVVRKAAFIGASGGYKPASLAGSLGMSVDVLAGELIGASLDNYAAVLLTDDSGQLLSSEQRSRLAAYVRNGGGLVILGAGPHQSPDDRNDPLNQAAALVPNPYDRKPIALTVALDASGSMGQTVESTSGRLMKFDQAAEAVLSLKRHLTDRDTLRVIVFSDRAKEVYASGADRPEFGKLASALRDVKPTGATKVFPAMELASKVPPDAERKGLLIIVSDLQTEKFDPPKAAGMLKKAGLDLAIVAIASPTATPSTEPLELLKKLLDAPLEKRDHLVGLARIFAGFLRTTRGGAVRKGRFTLSAKNASGVGAALVGKPVDSYIVSASGAEADVILRIGGDDIMARRTVGLGRSVSIALASAGGANSGLLASDEFTDVLAASMKWSARPEPDPRFSGSVTRSGRGAIVNLRAAEPDGAPINMLKLSLRTLADPQAGAEKTPMEQIAPGRYAARIALERLAGGVDVSDASGAVLWRGGAVKTYRREFDAVGPNYANLHRLASLTAGRIVETHELAELAHAGRYSARWEMWPWLAGLALALMLLNWLASRTVFKAMAA